MTNNRKFYEQNFGTGFKHSIKISFPIRLQNAAVLCRFFGLSMRKKDAGKGAKVVIGKMTR